MNSSPPTLPNHNNHHKCPTTTSPYHPNPDPDPNHSSSSTSASTHCRHHLLISPEEQYTAHCLILLAQGLNPPTQSSVYRCKTCKRAFPSFQALGGHRASHKKPRSNPSPPPNNQDDDDDDVINIVNNNDDVIMMKSSRISCSRVHECSICRSEFPSGQALGGHMRRHRPPNLPAPSPSPPPDDRPIMIYGSSSRSKYLPLDLNLPAPLDDDDDDEFDNVVFPPTPMTLVDCP